MSRVNIKSCLLAALLSSSMYTPFVATGQVQIQPGVIDRSVSKPTHRYLDSDKAKKRVLKENQLSEPATGFDDSLPVFSQLNKVLFRGNTALKDAFLQNLISPFLGKSMNKGELARLKYEIKKAYYHAGYIFVRVITPPQKIKDGVLQVVIFEAKRGDVEIVNDGVLSSFIADSLSSKIKENQSLNENDLESLASDFKDLQGVDSSLILRPGKTKSTTDLMFILSAKDEASNYVGVDNYGSNLTGKTQAYAHLEKNNLFKLGEKFYGHLRRSDEQHWMVNIGNSIPIGYKNFQFESSYLYSKHDIVGRLKDLRASGESSIWDASFSSKLLNTVRNTFLIRTGYQDRTHTSFLRSQVDSKDRLNKLYAESSFIRRSNNSMVYANVRASKGIGIFGMTNKGDALASRNSGDQNAYILEPTLFIHSRPLNKNNSLKFLINGQVTSSNLLSSDLFSVGGYHSVRGFNVAQESAEAGYNFTLEYLRSLPILNSYYKVLEAGFFMDGATVYSRIDGTVEDKNLYSSGFTMKTRLNIPKAGEVEAIFDWAHPIGRYNSSEIANNTFYFNLRKIF